MATASVSNSQLIWPTRTFVNMLEKTMRKPAHAHAPKPVEVAEPLPQFRPARPLTRAPEVPRARIAAVLAPMSVVAETVRPVVQPMAIAVHAKPIESKLTDTVSGDSDELPTAARLIGIDFQRRQQLLVSQVNRTLKVGCHVMAWPILPPELFRGDLGRFLAIACDFHAYGPGNTMLLPATASGVVELDLPRHPMIASDAQKSEAKRRVGLLRTKVSDGHKRAALAIQQGDFSQLYNRTEQQQHYRRELTELIASIAVSGFGSASWTEHESRFRAVIKAM